MTALFYWTGAAVWLALALGTAALAIITALEWLLGPTTPPPHWPHPRRDDD